MKHIRHESRSVLRWCTAYTACAALGVAFTLLLTAGCAGEASGAADPSEELTVRRGAVTPQVLLTGELAAAESTNFVTPNVNVWPMRIRWLAEEGAEVAAGDMVVEYDNSQLTGNLEMLRSQVVTASNTLSRTRAQASSDMAQAFFDLEQKKGDHEKAKLAARLPRDLTSEQEWAKLQLDLEKAQVEEEKSQRAMDATRSASEAAIDVDRLALDKARLALERAESGLEVLSLRAPRDGIVLITQNPQEDRPFETGDNTWPGFAVATLPELSSLRVVAKLSDVDDGRIEVGDAVVASLDAFPGEELTGTVQKISRVAEQEGRRSARRAFQVIVTLDGIDPARMRPGMSVKVVVAAAPSEGLVAPRAALRFGEAAGRAELLLAGGGTRDVTVGVCDAFACALDDAGGAEEGTRLRSANEGGRS